MTAREQRGKARVNNPVVLGVPLGADQVGAAAPRSLLEMVQAEPQKAFPAIAKDLDACARIQSAVQGLQTVHLIHNVDSRAIDLQPES